MRVASVLLVSLLSGCGACEKGGSAADGPHAYVRCMDVDPPDARSGSIGRTRFAIEDRVLTLTTATPLRIVAFRGAGEATTGLDAALLGVKEHSPGLVLVLGELGETSAHVAAHLAAFEKLAAPVVVLASGADVAEAVHDAWDDAEVTRVFDGRALRAIVAGDEVLVLASGAPLGRYAASEAHCGASSEDLEALGEDAPEGRRWLVSWAAPLGSGALSVSRGFADVEAGSAQVASLARALDAKGGIFGFPATHALVPATAGGAAIEPSRPSPDLRIVVTRIAGAGDSLADGARIDPSAALFELGPEGLAYMGQSVSAGH